MSHSIPPACILVVLGAVHAAGCIQLVEDNLAPRADLRVPEGPLFTGKVVDFDASSSFDPDGNLTRIRFAFGDGSVSEIRDAATGKVGHVYRSGGVYRTTVTVWDEWGATSAASAIVPIHERLDVASHADGPTAAAYSARFEVRKGVDDIVLRLRVNASSGSPAYVQAALREVSGDLEEEWSAFAAPGNDFVAVWPHPEPERYRLDVTARGHEPRFEGALTIEYEPD